MRSIKGSIVGLVLVGIFALAPTAAFAHGGGGGFGGGHGGGGGFGGGHGGGGGFGGRGGGASFGGGHAVSGHFGGVSHFAGGGHFAGFADHGFTGRSFAQHQGSRFVGNGDHFRHGNFRHDSHFFFGAPYWYDYPYYGYDDPYYGYNDAYGDYDQNPGDYADGPSAPAEVTLSQDTVIAVQRELIQLGYYHGQVDGLIGPQTERAIRWFQSVDKLPITGQLDGSTLKALQIS
jgi:hypothetical protein